MNSLLRSSLVAIPFVIQQK